MKTKSRIYYKDRYTNKIGYYETVGPSISYDEIDQYMKTNKKIFLYITNITDGLKGKDKKELTEHKS